MDQLDALGGRLGDFGVVRGEFVEGVDLEVVCPSQQPSSTATPALAGTACAAARTAASQAGWDWEGMGMLYSSVTGISVDSGTSVEAAWVIGGTSAEVTAMLSGSRLAVVPVTSGTSVEG